MEETSHIAHYNQPPMLHLLSPARSAVTQDLANFWCSTCVEVKKDLKGGYPKHFWPEDSLVAEEAARAKGRRGEPLFQRALPVGCREPGRPRRLGLSGFHPHAFGPSGRRAPLALQHGS